jgi:hypothetical protein
MLDPELQQRFARHCADAAFGYSAASAAACAAFTEQVLKFWGGVLQPEPPEPPKREVSAWPWPLPVASPDTHAFNPFAWALPKPTPAAPVLPGNPWEAMAQFAEVMSNSLAAMSSTPVRTTISPSNPMAAWLTMFPFAQQNAAWPMAVMMMSRGVPHSVAWPAAEANAAVLEAADVATKSIQKAFASYHAEGGHAASHDMWPTSKMLTMIAMVPMNVGTLFTAFRPG